MDSHPRCLSWQVGHLDSNLLHFSFIKQIFSELSCQLKLYAFVLAMQLFVNVFAVQYVQGSPVKEAQRSLDLVVQVSLSLTTNCLFF